MWRVFLSLKLRMNEMSLRVGMGSVLTWGARCVMTSALCSLCFATSSFYAQDVPLVWNAEWQVIQPEDSASQMGEEAWRDLLSSAMILQPPQRILGLPLQHTVSRITGRWKAAHENGESPPRGSASAFDFAAIEQSRRLFESRMLRMGHLDPQAHFDTTRDGNRVNLLMVIKPGRRVRCKSIQVEGEGSGLSDKELTQIQRDWSSWSGDWLDLDGLDRARTTSANKLQAQGWYGFLVDHLHLEIDTSRSRSGGTADLTLRILARNLGGLLAPHRKGTIQSVQVEWRADSPLSLVDTLENGIRWLVPEGRDIRPISQQITVRPGDRFNPENIAETRQLLRSLPIVEGVDLEVIALPDSAGNRAWPLQLKATLAPSPRKLMRVNGGLTSRQGPGGEIKFALSDLDFRHRMERLSIDMQAGLETVTPYLNNSSDGVPESDPWLNSRILAAGIQYSAARIIPFGADRFPKSNRPESRLSLAIRDENRPKFSRTYLQVALIEQFIENPATGSRIELRPLEITLTASRIEPRFAQELQDLGSSILTSTFASRAMFATGASWWLQPQPRPGRSTLRLHLEFEAAGNLFHAIDPRAPESTTVPIPTLFGSNSPVEVARYTRWVVDARWGWTPKKRTGIHARAFIGLAASTIPGAAVPFEKQFYVGGPNSLRGWRAMGLGPGQSDSNLQGVRGDIRIETNVEGRQYINEWIQLALFVDAGNIWMTRPEAERPNAHFARDRFFEDLGISAGAGVRLDFGYFLLRCDFGRPLRYPGAVSPTSKRWRIHPAVSLPF